MTSPQGNVRPIVETVISPSRDDGASIASPSNDATVTNNAVITPNAEDTLFHEVDSRQEYISSVMQPRNRNVPASTLVERRRLVQSQSIVAPSNNSCPPRIQQSNMNPGSSEIISTGNSGSLSFQSASPFPVTETITNRHFHGFLDNIAQELAEDIQAVNDEDISIVLQRAIRSSVYDTPDVLRLLREQSITNVEGFMAVFNHDDPKKVIEQMGYSKSRDHSLPLTKMWVYAQFLASRTFVSKSASLS